MTHTDSPLSPRAQDGADLLLRLLEGMIHIRRFEELVVEVYGQQDMKSPVHLYIGEEAVAVGVCDHLRPEDYLFSTHRNHGHCLAKGMRPEELYAEFYGREAGCCRGKGGSMHSSSAAHNILGTSAIVGGGIPLAAGAALASLLRRDGRISVGFFGDGASEEGTFHESLSFAALKKLPVLFVCENNFYATASPLRARQPDPDIHRRAQGYGIPATLVDGNDVVAVWEAAGEAVARIRDGRGPQFLECRTYRWKGHVGPECDWEKGCRPREELLEWMERCPIARLRERLGREALPEERFQAMIQAADARHRLALEYARACPFPPAEEALTQVYQEN